MLPHASAVTPSATDVRAGAKDKVSQRKGTSPIARITVPSMDRVQLQWAEVERAPSRHRLRRGAAAAIALVVASGASLVAWHARRVRRPVEASGVVTEPVLIRAEGHVVARPGAQVTLRAEILATIAAVHIVEGQTVSKGQQLLEFRDAEYRARLSEAFASIGEASARLRARATDAHRTKILTESGALPKADMVDVVEAKSAAQAKLAAAAAQASRLRIQLGRTKVVAPIDGTVIAAYGQAGETVEPGADLFVIANLSDLRIEAEVDEAELGRLQTGERAEVTCEAFPGKVWQGVVEEVPLVVGAPKLRPQDPSRPTDTGVVLVKVRYPTDAPLRLGERVSVRIDPAGHRP